MVQRETEKNQIRALLDAYNYEAISMMKPLLPSESMTLIHFLQMRAEYRYAEAEETAKLLGRTLPFRISLMPEAAAKKWKIDGFGYSVKSIDSSSAKSISEILL